MMPLTCYRPDGDEELIMNNEAHHLREQAQHCLLLAGIADQSAICDVLRGLARNLVVVAERLEGFDNLSPRSSEDRVSNLARDT
jgi:hypothetical protein